MSRAVNAIVIGIAVFVVLTGSIWYVMVAREPNRITASVDRAWVGDTGDRFEARVTFENPYDYEVTFHRYDYKFLVNGEEWAGGGDAPEELLRPHAKTTVRLDVNFSAESVSAWFKSHVAGDEESVVQLRGEAVFSLSDRNKTVPFGYRERFSTKILESLTEAGNCERAKAVCLAGGEGRWGLKDDAVVLELRSTLGNPTGQGADLGNTSLTIRWEGVEVATANTHGGYIEADEELRVDLHVVFEHEKLMEWWRGHTRACEDSAATAVLQVEADYVKEDEEDETETPTPSTANQTPSPTTASSPSNTTSSAPSSPTPTTSSTPSPTPTSGTTGTGGPPATTSSAFAFAAADASRPVEFELARVKTAFVCTHD